MKESNMPIRISAKGLLLGCLFLLFAVSSCVKEEVTDNAETVTVIMNWGSNVTIPEGGMVYYLYNMTDDKNLLYSCVIDDATAEGFTRKLPVGTYRLAGYNKMARESTSLVFDTGKKYGDVIAELQGSAVGAGLAPVSFYAVSDTMLTVEKGSPLEIYHTPVRMSSKALTLQFLFAAGVSPESIKGTLQGVFTSFDVGEAKAYGDKGYVDFRITDVSDPTIKIRMVDLYRPGLVSVLHTTYQSKLIVSMPGSNDLVRVGEVDLQNVIIGEAAKYNGKLPDAMTLKIYVVQSKDEDRLLLTPYFD